MRQRSSGSWSRNSWTCRSTMTAGTIRSTSSQRQWRSKRWPKPSHWRTTMKPVVSSRSKVSSAIRFAVSPIVVVLRDHPSWYERYLHPITIILEPSQLVNRSGTSAAMGKHQSISSAAPLGSRHSGSSTAGRRNRRSTDNCSSSLSSSH